MDQLDEKGEATTPAHRLAIMSLCHDFSEAVMAGNWGLAESYARGTLSRHDERNPNPPGDMWIGAQT